MTIGVIVEGVSDRARIHAIDESIRCFVLFGTPFGGKLRRIIDGALAEVDKLYIMTDPDEAGDRVAEAIMRDYPHIPRVQLDPTKCRVQRWSRHRYGDPIFYKYGVEYASVEYLTELLRDIKEGKK